MSRRSVVLGCHSTLGYDDAPTRRLGSGGPVSASNATRGAVNQIKPTTRLELQNGKGSANVFNTFEDMGMQFLYPINWQLDADTDGRRTVVELRAPGDTFVFFLTFDENRPMPDHQIEEALEAVQSSHPHLYVYPRTQVIDGFPSVGYDVELFSLDLLVNVRIRSYQTPRRTVTIFAQWEDDDDDLNEKLVKAVLSTLNECDDLDADDNEPIHNSP